MSRRKLKCGGRSRKKALFGADGAIMAAATLASAAMTTAATAKAAKEQANAIVDNANTQAEVLKQTNENNTQLQKQSIDFTKQQNAEIRNQQKDIQTSLQMLAGQQNMNAFNERNKMQVKYGGRRKLKRGGKSSSLPYGGGGNQFKVTDGGYVYPIADYGNGQRLYQVIGDTHNQHHKAPDGKIKTGVGLKTASGEIIEAENKETIFEDTNNGEMLINSAHNLPKTNFNPTEAVLAGMHPKEAFQYQEAIKDVTGYNDDGTKAKCGGRRKLRAMMGIYSPIGTTTMNQFNVGDTAAMVGGAAYVKQQEDETSSPVARCGKRVSLRRRAALGSFFNTPYWQNYGGATMNAAGNLLGAGISWIGNAYASRKLSNAYNQAGNILADAYGQLQTIDMDMINKSDYTEGLTSMAAIRDANYRNNAMRERVRRDREAYDRDVNRNTLSSAARQLRLASNADRYNQRISELAEQEANINENIRQGNMERITQVSGQNADRRAQAIRDYTGARLALAQYNNDIVNQRITGAAQARADALTNSASVRGSSAMANANAFGNALSTSANAFATAYDNYNNYNKNLDMALLGADSVDKVDYLVMNSNVPENRARAKELYDSWKNGNSQQRKYANRLASVYGFDNVRTNSLQFGNFTPDPDVWG